jgi:hypothetical protein
VAGGRSGSITPLFPAAARIDIDLFETLIEAPGIDINAKVGGVSAYQLAKSNDRHFSEIADDQLSRKERDMKVCNRLIVHSLLACGATGT